MSNKATVAHSLRGDCQSVPAFPVKVEQIFIFDKLLRLPPRRFFGSECCLPPSLWLRSHRDAGLQ